MNTTLRTTWDTGLLRLRYALLMFGILLAFASSSIAQTVTTDKDDYAPGEYVIVTGSGWTPGETVSFDFHETPKVCTSDHHERSTVADSEGNILYNQFLINTKHIGVSFVLTATGQTSGATAITLFTDANVRVVTSSGSVSINYTVKNSLDCTGVNATLTKRDNPGTEVATTNLGNFTAIPVTETQSVLITAPLTNSDGRTFIGFTSNYYFETPNSDQPNTICVRGNSNSGTIVFSANYGSCTTPAPPEVIVVDNCDGTSTLSTTASGALKWNTGAITSSITVSTAGEYTVTTTVNGCTSAAGKGTAAPKTTPAKPTISASSSTTVCPGSLVLLNSSSVEGNQWYKDGVAISGATSQIYDATESGSYAVVVTSNECSSVASDAINVTVTDNQRPVINAVSPITSNTDTDACGAVIEITAPAATDNCSVGAVSGSRSDNKLLTDAFPVGTTTITWNVTDANGNAAVAVAQTVTVTDNQRPVIAAVSPITSNTDTDACGAVIEITAPAATDNCSVGAVSGSRSDNKLLTDAFPVGTTTITWNVTDANGNAAVAVAQTVTVTDNQRPVINAPANISVNNDAGICGASVAIVTPTASDNCGVGLPIGTRNDGLALTDAFPVGTTTITWNVTDANGNAATTATQTVTVVNNIAPVVGSITASTDKPISIETGLVTLTVNFADNNVTSATFNWRDGSALQTVSVSGNSVTVSHKYTAQNIYAPVVTITDACGIISDPAEYLYVVVYDPKGGFVTGGGWINSPRIPELAYMQVAGIGNFGFNAKYKTGKNEVDQVDGSTTFHVNAGNMSFKSSSHAAMSLVIANHKATYTGEGTINGGGAYEFRVVAVDGDLIAKGNPDFFRIRIWVKGQPSNVVYDNQFDALESAEPSGDNTRLGAGSIVIHKPTGGKTTTTTTTIKRVADEELVEAFAAITAYPNPLKEQLFVELPEMAAQQVSLTIYHLDGRVMTRKMVQTNGASMRVELAESFDQWAQGVYLLKVDATGQQKVIRLIK